VVSCAIRISSRTPLSRSGGLVDDTLDRAADRRALDERDGAEGARAAAAIGHFEVGACPGDRDAQRVAFVAADGRGFGQVVERAGVRTLAQLSLTTCTMSIQRRVPSTPSMPGLLGHFHAVALGQASGGDQKLVTAFAARQLAQDLEGFFLGRADKSAGVDDQHIGARGVVHGAVTIADEQLRHRIRVDGVLGAAE
jgi:hypothetical protein